MWLRLRTSGSILVQQMKMNILAVLGEVYIPSIGMLQLVYHSDLWGVYGLAASLRQYNVRDKLLLVLPSWFISLRCPFSGTKILTYFTSDGYFVGCVYDCSYVKILVVYMLFSIVQLDASNKYRCRVCDCSSYSYEQTS